MYFSSGDGRKLRADITLLTGFSILPIPPFQELRLVARVCGVVHGAAHHVEHTAIHSCSFLDAMSQVKSFRVFPFELPNGAES